MKKGIIFDMDGTLWDSAENVAASWNLALEQAGYQRQPITKYDMYHVMGKTMDVIADILFPDAQPELKEKILSLCCRIENEYLREHGGTLYPKLRSTLEKLKETYHLYIVSNCQSGYIEAFLEYYQFGDLFEDMECFGNNGKQKADNIRLVAARNELEAAVYVGDIQGDYDASMAAGVKFIHAAYGFGTIREEVAAIRALEELPKVAEQII